MPGEPKTYAPRAQAVGGGLVNAIINGAAGFVLVSSGETLPLWGLPSVSFDLAAMAFGIAFGTGLVVTFQLRNLERKGLLLPPELSEGRRQSFEKWPRSILQRAINLGVLGAIFFAPLPLLGLWLLWPSGLGQTELVLFKAMFGALEGAIITPIIGAAAFEGPAAARSAAAAPGART